MQIIHNGKRYNSIADCFADIDKQERKESIRNDMFNMGLSVVCFCMANNQYCRNNQIRMY